MVSAPPRVIDTTGTDEVSARVNGTEPSNGHAFTDARTLIPKAPPENVEDVAGALLVASGESVAAGRELARSLPPGAAGQVFLYCLPEEWRDEAAVELFAGLDEERTQLLLTWFGRQWWEGYRTGRLHGQTGLDLDA